MSTPARGLPRQRGPQSRGGDRDVACRRSRRERRIPTAGRRRLSERLPQLAGQRQPTAVCHAQRLPPVDAGERPDHGRGRQRRSFHGGRGHRHGRHAASNACRTTRGRERHRPGPGRPYPAPGLRHHARPHPDASRPRPHPRAPRRPHAIADGVIRPARHISRLHQGQCSAAVASSESPDRPVAWNSASATGRARSELRVAFEAPDPGAPSEMQRRPAGLPTGSESGAGLPAMRRPAPGRRNQESVPVSGARAAHPSIAAATSGSDSSSCETSSPSSTSCSARQSR